MRRLATAAVLLSASLGVLAAPTPSALACAFDAALPAYTLVDRLFDADRIVLARADPENPLRFAPVEELPARHEPAGATDPIPLVVDDATRRRLESRPGEAVLLAHDPIDDVWRRLADVDADLRPMIDRILAEAPSWETPMDPARFRIAAEALSEPDLALRRLALLELHRAPYGTLRDAGLRLDADALLDGLQDPSLRPLHPVQAMLLGFTESPRAKRVLEGRLRAAAEGRDDPAGLGGYAVALIEMEGTDGVDRVMDLFFTDDAATSGSAPACRRGESIVEALAIQAQAGPPEVRSRIAARLGEALARRPDLVAPAARRFGARAVWDISEAVETAIRERRLASSQDLIAAASYLALAKTGAPAEDAIGQ